MLSTVTLYHGTASRHVDAILREGIQPGDGRTFPDLFVPPGYVFLSNTLSTLFAIEAALVASGVRRYVPAVPGLLLAVPIEQAAVLEVRVDSSKLHADDDFLDQARWRESLACIGSVAHRGPIFPSQIVRVAVFDCGELMGRWPSSLFALGYCEEAAISPEGFERYGPIHRAMLTAIMSTATEVRPAA